METKELDLYFRQLRYSVIRLLDIDDEIENLEIKRNGVIKQDPAQVIPIEKRLDTLSYERNHHIYVYMIVEKCLICVKDEEDLRILELKYWYDKTNSTIALALEYEKSTITKRLEKIMQSFTKVNAF